MATTTAKYEWYGETKTMQLTPHNYGHRFQYDGVTYQIERDAKRNSKWNVYRVTWNEQGTRRIHHPLVQLAASRKQAIADALFLALLEDEQLEDEQDEAPAEDAVARPAPTAAPAITRTPVHASYDTLGDADNWGEEFYLLIDGQNIGTTWYCPASYVRDGERWASDGPAGLSMSHRTREDAEQAQLKAAGIGATTTTVTTEPGPAPQPEPAPLSVTWEQALAEAKEKGVGRCSDHAAMAVFCDATITYIVGAVSGQLIWEGAMRKGLSFKELGRLASRDPIACSELMWV